MNISIKKTVLLFFLVCIVLRFFLAFLAFKASNEKLKLYGFIGVIIFLGFLYQYINKSQSGSIRGTGYVWWNDYRIIHSIVFLAFGILALSGNKKAYLLLVLDVMIGIYAGINHYLKIFNYRF